LNSLCGLHLQKIKTQTEKPNVQEGTHKILFQINRENLNYAAQLKHSFLYSCELTSFIENLK
jgi:hypothetical protein